MDLSRFFPPRLLDQSFGLCITPEDLIFPSYNFHRTSYYRPWKWYMQRAEKDFGSTIHDEEEKFKIALDVQHFQPNEINVKVADREIIIEGKHEERQDNHGFISRQFRRRYILPHDCNADSVFSSLSSDGVLTVSADKIKEMKSKEITVPIKMCETCPKKDLKTKMDKIQTEDIKKKGNETSNTRMEIMLREDHCCLLRPELLGSSSVSSGTRSVQTKQVIDDISLKKSTEKREHATDSKKSVKEDIASGQTSGAKVQKSEICELINTEKSKAVASGAVASSVTASKVTDSDVTDSSMTENIASGITSTMLTESIASGLTSSVKADTKISGMISTGKTEKADALLCGLSTAGKTEKAESLVCGMSSAGKSEQTEAVACGITSEVLTEKAETSSATKSELCNMKSTLSETIQIQESSSSYSSSMASSIKETTEKISEIVSDISAQLREAAENI